MEKEDVGEGGGERGSKGRGKTRKLRRGPADREMEPGVEGRERRTWRKTGRSHTEVKQIEPAGVVHHRATEVGVHRGTTGKEWVGKGKPSRQERVKRTTLEKILRMGGRFTFKSWDREQGEEEWTVCA